MSATGKFIKLGVDKDVAEKLVSAKLFTPKSVKETSLSKLREITGLSQSATSELRNKFDRS